MEPGVEAIEIFFSYHHEDERLRDKLERHLSPLKREGQITNWHDRKISPGWEVAQEINVHLNTAQVILLLISASFMHSDYCYGIEIKRAMERHTAGEARVIPVILRPVDWRGAPFGRLQALPTGTKSVVEWRIQDKAFENIAKGIRTAVEELRTKHRVTPTLPILQKDSIVVYVAEDIQKAVEELRVEDTGSPSSLTLQKVSSIAAGEGDGTPKAAEDTHAEDNVISPSSTSSDSYIVHENRESTMTDHVGQHLGNYRLIKLIGQGGFADIYLGEHVHLSRRAAIKVLRTRLTEGDAQKFQEEAKIIAGLEHRNIVKVLEFGFADNNPFFVMDFAPYGSLRYPKGTRLPPVTIVPYVKQVAVALQYAHERRVIHRDVKPENLLLGANNEVLLSDFGVAVVESTRSRGPQDIAGTVAYMAPEQLNNNPHSASDQYALGVVVYEWLSGNCPFKGSFQAIANQHMSTPPPKIPGVSSEIEEVVMKALAKKPEERYAKVREFASALELAILSPHDG
jgi:tRNA A-37 threonylcarbamoyl transferase component Bud32